MRITFSDAGKRFNREWIFRHLDYDFLPSAKYAITGPNGSGKSTLLQVMSGSMAHNAGTVTWLVNGTTIDTENIYRHFSVAAPYLQTIEEFTAKEFLSFHSTFKPFMAGHTVADILKIVGLEHAANKQIRYYSSGMKQRVKLAQAIFSDVPLLLLDEPCTNLDNAGIELYHNLVHEYCSQKTIVVCSNDSVEYSFCDQVISIMDYK